MREVLPGWVDFSMHAGCDGKVHAGLLPPPADDDEPQEPASEEQVAAVERALGCKLYRGWPVCETEDVRRVFAAAGEALHGSEGDAWLAYRRWFSDWPRRRSEPYIEFHCRHLTLGEVGAALSHLSVIEAAAAEIAADAAAAPEALLVFEDDARPLPGALDRLREEIARLRSHGFEWDLIYLRASLYSLTPEEPLEEVPDSGLFRAQHRKVTDAYCLSQRGVLRIAASGFRECMFAFDDFLPSLHSQHPRRDVMVLPCVERARAGPFVGLSFGNEVLSEVARMGSETSRSPCVIGDHGVS